MGWSCHPTGQESPLHVPLVMHVHAHCVADESLSCAGLPVTFLTTILREVVHLCHACDMQRPSDRADRIVVMMRGSNWLRADACGVQG